MYHNSINKSVNIYFVIMGPGGFGILSFCASVLGLRLARFCAQFLACLFLRLPLKELNLLYVRDTDPRCGSAVGLLYINILPSLILTHISEVDSFTIVSFLTWAELRSAK
jgi:hypothetical protein